MNNDDFNIFSSKKNYKKKDYDVDIFSSKGTYMDKSNKISDAMAHEDELIRKIAEEKNEKKNSSSIDRVLDLIEFELKKKESKLNLVTLNKIFDIMDYEIRINKQDKFKFTTKLIDLVMENEKFKFNLNDLKEILSIDFFQNLTDPAVLRIRIDIMKKFFKEEKFELNFNVARKIITEDFFKTIKNEAHLEELLDIFLKNKDIKKNLKDTNNIKSIASDDISIDFSNFLIKKIEENKNEIKKNKDFLIYLEDLIYTEEEMGKFNAGPGGINQNFSRLNEIAEMAMKNDIDIFHPFAEKELKFFKIEGNPIQVKDIEDLINLAKEFEVKFNYKEGKKEINFNLINKSKNGFSYF